MRLILVLLSFVYSVSVAASAVAQCAAGDIGGTIFRDFDGDGTRGTFEAGFGASGMTVTIVDGSGSSIGTASVSGDGSYFVDNPSVPPGGFRVELSGLPSYLRHGAVGTNSNSSVVFGAVDGCSYDFAVANPAEHCATDPNLVTSCYQNGSGVGVTDAAVVTFPYVAQGKPAMFGGSGPNPVQDAQIQEIGAVWGAALQRSTQRLFLAAMTHRHVGFGPEGIGGVYILDYSSGTGSLVGSFTLEGTSPINGGGPISLGSVTRTNVVGAVSGVNELSSGTTQRNVDLDAYDKVGKSAFGDVEMSEDDNTLWLVNLFSRSIITVDVSLPTASLPGQVTQTLIASLPGVPSCSNGEFRPWAISLHDGAGFLGGVCSAENSGARVDLDAYVLRFDPNDLAAGFSTVLSYDLDHTREFAAQPTEVADWQPWNGDATTLGITFSSPPERFPAHSQPVLSNIKFTEDGSMVLGLADRWGMQMGFRNYPPTPDAIAITTGNGVTGITGGDTVFACRTGTSWALEGDALCPVNEDGSTAGRSRSLADGPSETGEYFFQDSYFRSGVNTNLNPDHDEVGQGAVLVVPGTGRVISAALDPFQNQTTVEWFTGGFHWYLTVDGTYDRGFIVTPNPLFFPGYFGKASGLGEAVALCAEAPLEIGNRVWIDADRDGQQDPGELPIAGVTIELIDVDGGSAIVGTATTDSNGLYLFGGILNSNLISGETVRKGRNYVIRIQVADAALGGLSPTSAVTGSGSTDSNGVAIGAYVQTAVVTGGAGENDHTFDFGFNTAATPTPTPSLDPLATDLDSAVASLEAAIRSAIRWSYSAGATDRCKPVSRGRRTRELARARSLQTSAWESVWAIAAEGAVCSDANSTRLSSIEEAIDALVSLSERALDRCSDAKTVGRRSTNIQSRVEAARDALEALRTAIPGCE